MTKSDVDFNNDHVPVGYFLTFRTYGTWLHGDSRGSVDRFQRAYGSRRLAPNFKRTTFERSLLKQSPVILNSRQRAVIESSIKETCTIRKWCLWTVNVRTNHVHAVITAGQKPGTILSALKANATRALRQSRCWNHDDSPWAYRGSKKYLWTETELADAIAYVQYDQGEPLA